LRQWVGVETGLFVWTQFLLLRFPIVIPVIVRQKPDDRQTCANGTNDQQYDGYDNEYRFIVFG
jgi:hypothetical protein